jgi:hypothetical protein
VDRWAQQALEQAPADAEAGAGAQVAAAVDALLGVRL